MIGCEFYRRNIVSNIESTDVLDTCTELTAELCKLPGGRGGKFKLPTLTELHEFLFQSSFEEAHNATADVEATARCFLELIRIKNFKKENKVFLGDAGSLLLGTLIAIYLFHVLGLDYTFKEPYQMNRPLLTMSLIIYPLADLLRVFIIRI